MHDALSLRPRDVPKSDVGLLSAFLVAAGVPSRQAVAAAGGRAGAMAALREAARGGREGHARATAEAVRRAEEVGEGRGDAQAADAARALRREEADVLGAMFGEEEGFEAAADGSAVRLPVTGPDVFVESVRALRGARDCKMALTLRFAADCLYPFGPPSAVELSVWRRGKWTCPEELPLWATCACVVGVFGLCAELSRTGMPYAHELTTAVPERMRGWAVDSVARLEEALKGSLGGREGGETDRKQGDARPDDADCIEKENRESMEEKSPEVMSAGGGRDRVTVPVDLASRGTSDDPRVRVVEKRGEEAVGSRGDAAREKRSGKVATVVVAVGKRGRAQGGVGEAGRRDEGRGERGVLGAGKERERVKEMEGGEEAELEEIEEREERGREEREGEEARARGELRSRSK